MSEQTSHCTPNAGPTSNPGYQPPLLPSFPSLPLSQTDGVRSNITMEMLFSAVNIMNQRLERIDFVNEFGRKLHRRNQYRKNQLKEEYLKLQSHSMKYNLIFGGIIQTDEEEDTETILKNFIKTELDIPDADEIDFQNVHRLRPRRDGKSRNTIARFTHYKDHERVKKVVPQKLKLKPRFTVNQQYPTEISNRRQKLFPKLKELHRRNIRASFVYDQIIVNGQPYDPTREEPHIPIHNNQAGHS
ncbi:unnamed protein product [Mytilus coruscus]|uniref:Uncharacterized protein n=1 Tax=Mytilus coruscus TaxID=42192 RepID=A0A6J8CP37_MYTCO|nr:unnamed protein product [Mytilus coruscus]